MTPAIHFEIHAEDVPVAVGYYEAVFDWQVEDWSEFAGMPYFGVTTSPEDHLGINGPITQRQAPICSSHGCRFGTKCGALSCDCWTPCSEYDDGCEAAPVSQTLM